MGRVRGRVGIGRGIVRRISNGALVVVRMDVGVWMRMGMGGAGCVGVSGAETGVFDESMEGRADPDDAAEGEAEGQVAGEEQPQPRSGTGLSFAGHRYQERRLGRIGCTGKSQIREGGSCRVATGPVRVERAAGCGGGEG